MGKHPHGWIRHEDVIQTNNVTMSASRNIELWISPDKGNSIRRFVVRSGALGLAFFFALTQWRCSSSFPQVELRGDYDFSGKQAIGLYVAPTGHHALDETYARVFGLHLRSLGYTVANMNQLLGVHADSLVWTTHHRIADSLLARIPHVNLVAVVRLEWDSVFIFTHLSVTPTDYGAKLWIQGAPSLRVSCKIGFFDRSIRGPILAFAATDTARMYSQETRKNIFYFEFPWMLAARQLTDKLKDLPVCATEQVTPASNRLSVSLWVDESYRKTFPEEWKERLQRRVLYANDMLRSQFDTELQIIEFKEWDSTFDTSLVNVMRNLLQATTSGQTALRIGITLDNRLKTNWTEKSAIGYAIPLGTEVVVSSQPSFPGLGYWNPLEEALTLVHEIGHLLGAVHVQDETSIMHPTSGSFSDRFDDSNRMIVEAMKDDFLNLSERRRFKKYIRQLVELRKTPARNSIPILEGIAITSSRLYLKNAFFLTGLRGVSSLLSEAIPDSTVRLAVLGFFELKFGRLHHAKAHFSRVVELQPDFAEAHWYLSVVLKKLGETDQAAVHRKIARPFKRMWVIAE